MIKELKVYPAIICHLEDTIVDVAKKMMKNSARHIFVADSQNHAIGIISGTDFTNKVIAEGKNPELLKAKDVMNAPVESIGIKDEVEFAMAVMMRRKTYSCLVTDNGKIKGVVDYKSVMERIVKKITGENNGA